MFAVYDMNNKELVVGTFDKLKEVGCFLGLKGSSVSSMICKNILANGRYKIVHFVEEGESGQRAKKARHVKLPKENN